jgi:transcriptional regulator with XRE-family HTH domain
MTDEVGRRIGDFCRNRRQAGGLSQRELGELARVRTRFISEIERGKPPLRISSVNQVLAVFGKTLEIVEAAKKDDTS